MGGGERGGRGNWSRKRGEERKKGRGEGGQVEGEREDRGGNWSRKRGEKKGREKESEDR